MGGRGGIDVGYLIVIVFVVFLVEHAIGELLEEAEALRDGERGVWERELEEEG